MASNPTSAESFIPEKLRRHMRWLPEASEEERHEFCSEVEEFFDKDAFEKLNRLSPVGRLKWQLIRDQRITELIDIIRFERENPDAFHIAGRRSPRAQIPGFDSGSVPRDVLALRKREMPVHARATAVRWQDGKVVVTGYAFVANVPVARKPLVPRVAWLRRTGSSRRVPVRVRPRRELQATRDSKQALHCYDHAGFEIIIDPARLKSRGRWQPGTWQLSLALPAPGGPRVGSVAGGDIGSAGHSQARDLGDGGRLVVGFPGGKLHLEVQRPEVEVDSHDFVDGHLVLGLRSPADAPAERLPRTLEVRLKGEQDSTAYGVDRENGSTGWNRWTVRIPVSGLAVARVGDEPTRDLVATVVLADGTRRRAIVRSGFHPGQHPLDLGREVTVTTDGPGLLKLHDRARQAIVDRVEWEEDGRLVLEGSFSGGQREMMLVLRHGQRFEEHHLKLCLADGRFSARIDPDRMRAWGETVPLRQGRWYFSLRLRDAWDHRDDVLVKLQAGLVDSLPLTSTGAGRTYTVERRFFDRLFLASGSALRDDERGAYRQRMLREAFTSRFTKQPLREAVFYNSFGGKQFSDSPRAVFEEIVRRGIEVEHFWSVSDDQVRLPEGVHAVEWHSREWYEALARSRYVVTNVGLGDWYEKREDQVVVQTWHGTPLKKIGADLLGTPKANRAYIASLPHRFRQFDHVVSPNSFTTPIMERAFRCAGNVLESGYPRNDIFHRKDREEIAARVRETLGIPDGKKVVLYAPTWRDDKRHTATKFALDLQVDLAAARRELGEDHVFLFRKHPKILDAIPGAGQGFVWDVSSYPDIAELYLITDVLITDYSSVLFDFAHSERPMLFFTYDLEHYRDTLRGFYFDFTVRAPGPLIKTSEELIESIRNIDEVAKRYADKYVRFLDDFCEPRDGTATSRVVDRLLGIER